MSAEVEVTEFAVDDFLRCDHENQIGDSLPKRPAAKKSPAFGIPSKLCAKLPYEPVEIIVLIRSNANRLKNQNNNFVIKSSARISCWSRWG
jgi:hypothetical protein